MFYSWIRQICITGIMCADTKLPYNLRYCRGLEPAIFRLWGKGVSITLARMDQFIYNLGLVLCNSTGATGLPRKSSWRWRLESYVRAYGELHTANPVHSRTAAKRRSGAGSENCVGWKLLARYVTVMREGGGRGGGKGKRLCGQLTGSSICRGLEPTIFRLWG